MARDHARIRLDIWADEDFRDLTSSAQWLYLHLLSTPTLSFCGIADWRPARIAPLTAELNANDINTFADELQRGLFILIDQETEEVLIRSWVKHDGLLRSPNLTKALIKAHSSTASAVLRGVVVHELKRLKASWVTGEKLDGWSLDEVKKILRKRSISPAEGLEILSANPSVNPSGKGSAKGSGKGSGNPSATPYSLTPPLLATAKGQVSYVSGSPDDGFDACEASNG